MTVDKIYEEIIKIFNKEQVLYFTEWEKIKNIKHRIPNLFYIVKRKDSVYLGHYRIGEVKDFDRETLQIKKRHYVKSLNNFITFYENKVLIKNKYLTFKSLSNLRHGRHEIIHKLIPTIRKIYNIKPCIDTKIYSYPVVLLNEIIGITNEEYVNNLFPDIPQEIKNYIIKLPVNDIKILYLIKDECVDQFTILSMINGTHIDLNTDKLGNKYCIKDNSIKSKNYMNSYNNIDNYIMKNYRLEDNSIYRLIKTGEKDNVILGRSLFVSKYSDLFEGIENSTEVV